MLVKLLVGARYCAPHKSSMLPLWCNRVSHNESNCTNDVMQFPRKLVLSGASRRHASKIQMEMDNDIGAAIENPKDETSKNSIELEARLTLPSHLGKMPDTYPLIEQLKNLERISRGVSGRHVTAALHDGPFPAS